MHDVANAIIYTMRINVRSGLYTFKELVLSCDH